MYSKKANPGGTVSGEAIIGRKSEIDELWGKLDKQSVVLTAERRVGKTCVLRKMTENPRNEWVPLFCLVESCHHPIEFVESIYEEAKRMEAQSGKGVWLKRIRDAYKTISEGEIAGWHLPRVKADWKRLLRNLIEDVAENTGKRILVMLDEFPMMISNIIDSPEAGPTVAMELLNELRVTRQKFESSNRIRFVLSGSIGLHLVLQDLKSNHAYKGNPTNDMAIKVLSGMCKGDVELMCKKYLDEEGIERQATSEFDERMFSSTDGLPLYVQYICEGFQNAKRTSVEPNDVDVSIREMMDRPEVEWFANSAERIDNYYVRLGVNDVATTILKMLSHEEDYVGEGAIIDYVRTQVLVEDDEIVRSTLLLLRDDNYLIRDTSAGGRRYRFRYSIMRKWWEINKG